MTAPVLAAEAAVALRSTSRLAMTRKEAAVALRIGLTSLDILIQSGELPSAMVCGRRLITVADAEAYLKKKVDENAADLAGAPA